MNKMKWKTTRIIELCLILAFAFAMSAVTVSAKETEPVKPAKPTLKSVESTVVKKMTVTWKTVSNADGYEIWYKTGDTKEICTVEKGTTGKKTLKNLPGGKEYTVKVRSYRMEKDKKLTSGWSKTKIVTIKRTKWSDLQEKYAEKENVKQLIFVKYKGSSKADLLLYTKNEDNTWKKVLSCDAYTGQNGIDKQKEGDRRTPTGVFTLDKAFGIKADPGSKMEYTKVNKNLYWCGDKDHYNQMIDIRDYPHKCRGEHLIDYTKQYAYAMNINYNKEGVYGKGSAIFLHCFGYNAYTLGCVAVSQDNMKTILQTCEDNTKICIYWK